ncbi:HU family DNA-binding protein [Bacteroides sp. UBA939]|uniref:HU family DNA-binding protein n=1 Tax=Bacteroides sp. UBA939 TaxID=1946092 RepID=UPI0025BCC1CC|nr:HU family DNA-binding protein [Bacteroides sp. UBA939]
MAEYEMQESNLPNEEGERILYPRMKLWNQVNLEYIANNINYSSSFTPGDIIGLVRSLTQEIAYQMAQGNSVKVDGLGIFTPALGMRRGKERESAEKGGRRVNAMSIYVQNINFRADKQFIMETGRRCRLNRSETKPGRSSQKYTPEQRLKLAQKYLEEHPYMKVSDYCQLTGLLRNTAAKELMRWKEMPETNITTNGAGSHKLYVKRKETTIP